MPHKSKAAPKTRKKSTKIDAKPTGKTIHVGGELLLRDLAGEAGPPFVVSRAIVGRKKIQKTSDGAVLIKERDLLTLLRDEAPSSRTSTKVTSARGRSPALISKRETKLLERINAGLSEHQARRLAALDAQREEEALTPEEHTELLGLVDESERLAVGRAKALVELARHRKTTVPSLMRVLGLGVEGRG